MFCPKCGNEVQEGSAFCGKCGAPVGAAAGQQGATTGVGVAPGAPAPKRGGAKIGIVAAAVVVALLVVVGFATNGFGLGGVQPKDAVDVPAASQEQQTENAEEAVDNPAEGSADGQNTASDSAQEAVAGATVKSAVEAYTWDELSRISAEIAAANDEAGGIEVAKKYNLCTPDGKLDGTQVKSVTLTDGTQTTVQIIGFNHDDKTGGGKAGISFIFGDAIAEMPMNSSDTNAGGWEASQTRAYLNSDGMSLLPQELAGKIVAVDKLTNNVGQTEEVSAVSTTSDKLWLLSATELFGVIAWYEESDSVFNAEGSQYKLYQDKAVSSANGYDFLVKTNGDGPWYWWVRSPFSGLPDLFAGVGANGYPTAGELATKSAGIVPGFCV